MSGGKDSTVLIELTLIVAKELGIAKVPVMWLDQECEFESTVEYCRWLMHREGVEPLWMQIPFRLFNTTTHGHDQWLHVWGPGEEWVRDREPDSLHENIYGTDRFGKVLTAIGDHHFEDGCLLMGMRTEEAPWRRLGLTTMPTYKWVTWGAIMPKHSLLAPIYDWTWRDIWKAIHEHGWRYNTHYDDQYRRGVPVQNMRVSNYHHETAISSLFYLQEIEPETYDAAVRRLEGIATCARLGRSDVVPKKLPFMFGTWREYRDYLIDHLPTPENAKIFKERFHHLEQTRPHLFADPQVALLVYRAEVRSVVMNDWEAVLFDGFMNNLPSKLRNLPVRGRKHEAVLEGAGSVRGWA